MATNLPSPSGPRAGRTCRSKMSPPRRASSSRVRLAVGMVDPLVDLMRSLHYIAGGDVAQNQNGGPGQLQPMDTSYAPMVNESTRWRHCSARNNGGLTRLIEAVTDRARGGFETEFREWAFPNGS